MKKHWWQTWWLMPGRAYVLAVFLAVAFGFNFFPPHADIVLWVVAAVGAVPTVWGGLKDAWQRRVTIDVFNTFALAVAFGLREPVSAAFIVLMLTFAGLLDWYTSTKANRAIEKLLNLKPQHALLVIATGTKEVVTKNVRQGDVLLVVPGAVVPVDGVVVFGESAFNEAPVTGESMPVSKVVGDQVMAGTLNAAHAVKIRATRVGQDATLDRMVALIKLAEANKSKPHKLADKFAGIFFPVVLLLGFITYVISRDITMVAALFLVACADDIAVSIPLAMTAALGRAAQRGVIIKGGEWIDELGKVKMVVVDKTGTLTYGAFSVRQVKMVLKTKSKQFWQLVGGAEKFSEHPVGRAIAKEALANVGGSISDPENLKTYKGSGIAATVSGEYVALGDESLFKVLGIKIPAVAKAYFKQAHQTFAGSTVVVLINKKIAGYITVADVPRPEAKASIEALRRIGVREVVMLTGDNKTAALAVAKRMGITEVKADLLPTDKLCFIAAATKRMSVAMVGDGINDSPALARANVGIAMGETGTAVSVEAANVVILHDNLSRLPEMIKLGRQTTSVVHVNIGIWVLTNMFGFALVWMGFAGLATAALYNFTTDFLPLINSAKLFMVSKSTLTKK